MKIKKIWKKKEVQEALLEKLSSIERNLHLIAFSMYLQTKPNEVRYWEDEQEDKRYLTEGKKILNLDDLWMNYRIKSIKNEKNK